MTDRAAATEKGYLFNPTEIMNQAIARARDKQAIVGLEDVLQRARGMFSEGIRDAIREMGLDPHNTDPNKVSEIAVHAAKYVLARQTESPQDRQVITKLIEQLGGKKIETEGRGANRSVGQRTRSNSGGEYLN